MLYKHNHIVCNNLLNLAFALSVTRDLPRLLPLPIVLHTVPWCEDSEICLTVQSVKNIGEVSSLGVLQIKLLGTFMHRFLYEYVSISLG